MRPTGFQFYINKSADSPLNVYIDNVHVSPDYLPGDANLDNHVDLTDFTILAGNFNKLTGQTWATADFNGDGAVNLTDFTFLAAHFNGVRGQTPPAASLGASVPEPASIGGLAIMSAAVLFQRRRQARRRG